MSEVSVVRQEPLQLNRFTTETVKRGGVTYINHPEGVVAAWEPPPGFDPQAHAQQHNLSNIGYETKTDAITGESRATAYTKMTHEEYEALRQSPQGIKHELPALTPEQPGNNLGTVVFKGAPSPVRAKVANPPEIPPEDVANPEAPPGERTSKRLDELKAQREANNKNLIDTDAADEYVRFDDLHGSLNELISNIKGEPGTVGDYAAQGTRGLLGFVKDALVGVGELAYEGSKLAINVQQSMMTPAGIQGQILDGQILLEEIRLGNVTTGTMTSGATNTATSIGKAIVSPVTKPWAEGQYVESVTRGLAEIATLPLVALKSSKAVKTSDAINDAATANKTANTTGDTNKTTTANDAVKTSKSTGPNGDGGKIKQSKKKLQPNTPEHKADRWKRYQEKGGEKSYDEWSKQYDINMRNYQHGAARELDYRKVMNAGEGTLKTSYTNRQIDILKKDEMYAGQLKTGPVSLTKENALAIQKDAALVKKGWQVEHILEKGASKPYLDALKKGGIDVHIGPKIP